MSRFSSSQEFRFLHRYFHCRRWFCCKYIDAVLQCVCLSACMCQVALGFFCLCRRILINNIERFICWISTNYVIPKICYTRWKYKKFIWIEYAKGKNLIERTTFKRDKQYEILPEFQTSKRKCLINVDVFPPMGTENPIGNRTNVMSSSFRLCGNDTPSLYAATFFVSVYKLHLSIEWQHCCFVAR